MRIAIAADFFYNAYRSALPGLGKEWAKRHSVFYFGPAYAESPAFCERLDHGPRFHLGWPLPRHPALHPVRTMLACVQAVWALKREKIEMVYLHLYGRSWWMWAWILRLTGIPFVLTFHIGRGFSSLISWHLHHLRYLALHASRITAVSAETRRRLRALLGNGFAVEVVPLGVSADLAKDARNQAATPPYILSFAGFDNNKGADRLLMAFRDAALSDRALKLVLCGPESARLKPLIRLLKLDDRVRLFDSVPHEKALQLLRKCLFYVQVSKRESFCLSVLEAMAYGKAVLVSSSIGLASRLKQGKNAHLVNPLEVDQIAEGLRLLVRNPRRREALGAAARESATKLTWDVLGETYESLFFPTGTTRERRAFPTVGILDSAGVR